MGKSTCRCCGSIQHTRGVMAKFVSILQFRAKVGEEDAIVALHEDWQRRLLPRAAGYLYGELLSHPDDPGCFMSVAHYECKTACLAATSDPEYRSWYDRLASLIDGEPVHSFCLSAWSAYPDSTGVGQPSAP